MRFNRILTRFVSIVSPFALLFCTVNAGAQISSYDNLSGTSATPAAAGQLIKFTSVIAPKSSTGTTPTGTVTFSDGGTGSVLGTVVLVANNGAGVATLITSISAVGSHTISVAYSGDATYPATNSTINQEIAATVPFSFAPQPLLAGTPEETVSVSVVTAGLPAFFFLQAPANTTPSAVLLSCASSIPGAANCNFNPARLDLQPQASAISVLTVNTTGGSVVAASMGLSGIACAFCLPFFSTRRAIRRSRALLLTALMAVALFSIGCGGAVQNTNQQQAGKTAPGAYPITIRGTANGFTQSSTVFVVVR